VPNITRNARTLHLRRLELDEGHEVLPQVDRVEHEQETGGGVGVAPAALCDGECGDGASVGGCDVWLVGEGVGMTDGTKEHFDADAHVLYAVRDVVGGEVPGHQKFYTKKRCCCWGWGSTATRSGRVGPPSAWRPR
jgi:hypothetical protein